MWKRCTAIGVLSTMAIWGIPIVSHADVQVQIVLKDSSIRPSHISATKGETIKIHIANQGKRKHNLVIPDMYIFSPNLAPGETTDVSFVPDKTGSFAYYSDTSGTPEPGVKGTLSVS